MDKGYTAILTEELKELGLNAGYKAFDYIVFILLTCDLDIFLVMDEITIWQIASEKFGVTYRIAERNFKTLMASFYRNLTSSISTVWTIPSLSDYEMPTVKEFIIMVICNLSVYHEMSTAL